MTPTKQLPAMTGEVMTGGKAGGAYSPIVHPNRPNSQASTSQPAQIRSVAMPLFVPDVLQQPRWVNWRYELTDDGRLAKMPYMARNVNRRAASNRTSTWATLDEALDAYAKHPARLSGVGYNQHGSDVVGIDLDHCVDDAGNVDPWAAEIVSSFNTYTEISPSGHGIRMFGRGRKPGKHEKRGDVELYDGSSTRYLTFTGNHLPGTPCDVVDVTQPLTELYQRMFGAAEPGSVPRTTPAQPVNLDDAELLARAIAAKNGARFLALWQGDASAHSSRSEADFALVGALLFWTAGDEPRVDRLFRQSGLMREKWDRRTGASTYGALTITNCAAGSTQYYTPPLPRPANVTAAGEVLEALPTVQDLWRILHAHITHDGPRCQICGRQTPSEYETKKYVVGGVQCFRCKRSSCMDWQNFRAKQLVVQQEPHTWPAHYLTRLPIADYDALVDRGALRDVAQWFSVQSPDDVMTVASSWVISSLSFAVDLKTLAVTMAQAWKERVWLIDDDGNRKTDVNGKPLRSRLRSPKNAARAKRQALACDVAQPAPVIASVEADPVVAKRKAAFGLIDLDPVDAHTLLDIIAAAGGDVDHKRRKWRYPVEIKAQVRELVAAWAAVAGLDGRKEIEAFPNQSTGNASISSNPLCEQDAWANMTDSQREYARRLVHRDANRDMIEREVWQM